MICKVKAIVKDSPEIIFLSDTRLNSKKQISACNDLNKMMFDNGYDFFHCSETSIRGVAICIKKSIDYSIITQIQDQENYNFLLMKIRLKNTLVIIGSIYGPNLDSEINFYDSLAENIRRLDCSNIIIAGDWNATWSTSPIGENIDVFRMRNIPSLRRSEKIKRISQDFNLTDPFRVFYPTKKEFTYVPAINTNQNRSRLDFFLVSEMLLDTCINCKVDHLLPSNLFDHKQVSLIFKRKKQLRNLQIKKRFLPDPDLVTAVKLNVYETYIQHAEIGMNYKNELL
jgi:exonuclease III